MTIEWDFITDRTYDIGDTVTWDLWGGQRVTGRVTDVDFKNDSPIFIADNGHWGYDDQIIEVVSREN